MKKIFIILILTFISTALAEPNNQTTQPELLNELELPQPSTVGSYSLEQLLTADMQFDDFTDQPLSLDAISQLLWAGQGIVDPNTRRRTVYAQKDIDPIELYLVIKNGIYVYQPENEIILKTSGRDIRRSLSMAAGNESALLNAPCTIVIAASADKLSRKYSENAQKILYMLTGQVAQNMHLQAVSMGLAMKTTPVFDQSRVKSALEISPTQQPVYMASFGYPPPGQVPKLKQIPPVQQEQTLPPVKRAVILIPDDRIVDREFFDIFDILQIADIEVEVAAPAMKRYRTDRRGWIDPSMVYAQVNVEDFDAVVLVSGLRASVNVRSNPIIPIIRRAATLNKVVGAIGRSVRFLAHADIIENVQVTGSQGYFTVLRSAGAVYTNAKFERDGNIVTGQDYNYSAQFVKLIDEALEGIQSRPGAGGRYIDPRVLRKRGQSREDLLEQNN